MAQWLGMIPSDDEISSVNDRVLCRRGELEKHQERGYQQIRASLAEGI
jgi:hypothetical protein